MQRYCDAIAGLTGWRRLLIAFVAGAASTYAMAPYFFWVILFVTIPVLIWQLDGISAQTPSSSAGTIVGNAFLTGWAFGFGYFVTGLYWIGEAFLVEADKFAWLMPFAVSLLPAGLAIFFGVATGSIIRLWRPGCMRIFLLAWALFATECLRGHILTGLPWNLLGYSLTGTPGAMQMASVFGVYVLTYFAVLVFAVPAFLIIPGKAPGEPVAESAWWYAIILLCLFIVSEVAGQVRLSYASQANVQGVRLRLIQPNIAQAEKWLPQNREWITERYFKLSQAKSEQYPEGLKDVTHLIWPEVALPFLMARETDFLDRLALMLPESTSLVTGSVRIHRNTSENGEAAKTDILNSIFVFNDKAEITQTYDKKHLVPFGEYLPFQNLLEFMGLEQLTRIRGGFTAGTGQTFINPGDAPEFRPLICYEAIFPGSINNSDHRPAWMLNVTNDGWFGESTGPHQHLHQARMRAVEEGLPLIRAANTGVSAIIDPYGRIRYQLSLSQEGLIDSRLPDAIPATIYSKFGVSILLFFVLSGFLFPVLIILKKEKSV